MRERDIFDAALAIDDPPQRSAYLDATCAGDDRLRKHIEGLIRMQPQLGSFLEVPADVPHVPVALPLESPGTILGPYKLLEQIGEGGMGLVFMAEQLKPVRRKVALKVLKPGMDTRQIVARFEAERQALALMDHPNIAQIFDAGTTGVASGEWRVTSEKQDEASSLSTRHSPLATTSGRPYFVMELVRGVPITEFCDQRRLTTRQRLELFVTVCQAVQHAHQKGIIHRDLKPSNILVTLHDTIAVPKIIDFGIAKATKQPLTERSLFTHFSQMIGTPLYMSPEQAEMNGLDVDTRSDVYALGVLLYELLTGTTPFASERLKQIGFDEMRRVIREEEPPRPSQRVSTLDAAARSTLSEQRGTDVRSFEPTLRGELDWIVIKALEKDRNRRYESAGAFAQDVQRYLNDEAVEACPPSAGYRLRKVTHRNRRAIVTVGIIAATLVVATAVSLWQASEAIEARRLAEERFENEKLAQQKATHEAAVAKAVSDFLQVDLLRLADRQEQLDDGFVPNPNLTVREALHRAAAKIGERFRDQPLVEAALRTTIGEAYMGIGEPKLAMAQMEKALELYEANLAPGHPDVLGTMDKLAHVYVFVFRWGREKAIALCETVFARRQKTLGPDHPDTLESMQRLAHHYAGGCRFEEGISLCRQVLERRQILLGPNHPSTSDCMYQLAQIYRTSGHWEIAVPLAEELYEKAKTKQTLDNVDLRRSMSILATAYELVGRMDEAFALYEKTLDICKTLDGPDNYRTVAPLKIDYARGCRKAGKFEQGERLLREVLASQGTEEGSRGALGAAMSQQELALNLLMQGRYAEAESYAIEALAIYQKNEPESWIPFHAMSLVGGALLGQGKYAEAEPLLLEGYGGLKQREWTIYMPQRPRVAESLDRIVQFYEATNRPEKAREWREKLPKDKAAR